MVKNLEEIKIDVAQMSKVQLKQFRAWYQNFDSYQWDQQIEDDIVNDKLARISDEALNDYNKSKL